VADVTPELVRAYSETYYIIDLSPSVTLRIGLPCDLLRYFHAHYQVRSSVIITACNPRSQRLSETLNRQRHAVLKQQLLALGHPAIPAVARHPSNGWPEEPGFWVPGLSRKQGSILARHFDQNAIVYCGHDAPPSLVFCIQEP
jgi:hypothetical protein